jgi:opacity protein-like surface antigen
VGEFGHVGDMLPTLTSGLLSAFSPYDVRVSALYGEGGVRLLAAADGGVSPYVEATAGIARLTPHVSGFGSVVDAITGTGLNLLRSTDPILGVGGGVLLRGGPVLADVGYRYKQVAGSDSLAGLLAIGQNLRTHQVRFGIGVRF